MNKKICVVVTTINDGSFLEKYRDIIITENVASDITIIVIPDLKTPPQLYEKCKNIKKNTGIEIICPTIEEQDNFLTKLGNIKNIIPYNSDNRRNVGFLMALEKGCDILISIDDDNIPIEGNKFFLEHSIVNETIEIEAVNSNNGWFNICTLLETEPPHIYPRGFPYHIRHKSTEVKTQKIKSTIHINAGLWLQTPDTDAITHLSSPPLSKSFKGKSYVLGKNTWSPINTQNTALSAKCLPAYYFIKMGYNIMGNLMDRYGDIFSGYFVQACAKNLGYGIKVGTPLVNHIRNPHNYLKDLFQEIWPIAILEDITQWLVNLKLNGNNYYETYFCLTEKLEEQVEKFQGYIWNNTTKKIMRDITSCMKTWLEAIKIVVGEQI
jgi:hypothetical protein